jgi:hypothetical protein
VPKVLGQQQIEEYREQGFLSPVEVMPEDEALNYASLLQAAERDNPQQLNAENRNNPHLSFAFLDELVHHPLILDVVEECCSSRNRAASTSSAGTRTQPTWDLRPTNTLLRGWLYRPATVKPAA